jgi:lipoprotein-anchoring transpeptidase ErfK/SrfK
VSHWRTSLILAIVIFSGAVPAQTNGAVPSPTHEHTLDSNVNLLDDFDPFAPDAEDQLKKFDQDYEDETGQSAHINPEIFEFETTCRRENCPVFIEINKSNQQLALYIEGRVDSIWPVSTGRPGYTTPNLDTHPDGRIYDAYTSKKYPGGNYKHMGNMPYAIFVSHGVAIHGTGPSNWTKLGHQASHGCVRLHPDHAFRLNRLVRSVGTAQVWVTIF